MILIDHNSQCVCTLIHVLTVFVFLPPCPISQLAAIILRSWMSGLIMITLSLQVAMIKLTLANEIYYVVKLITYCAFLAAGIGEINFL